jgi:2-keto-4-pentenoate hydratase
VSSAASGGWLGYRGADGSLDAAGIARALVSARSAGRTLAVPVSDELDFPAADAYRVQEEVAALRYAAGERRAGWKLGYTSQAMRAQMGVAEPNFGPLTTAMLLPSGAAVPSAALQPRTEPEIGLRLGRRLTGPCTAAEALAACSAAVACLEVVDSVWAGYRFRLADNTADLSSAAWVAVGGPLPLGDLDQVRVTLAVNGSAAGTATGAAADGHPANGLAWLAGRLAATGRVLEPGDLVITGGLTAAVPVTAGDTVAAVFEPPAGDAVTVTVSGSGSMARTGTPTATGTAGHPGATPRPQA